MDDQQTVIDAVELPAAGARAWFEAVCEVASNRPDDWTGFVDQLRASGKQHDSSIDDAVIDRFVENLERVTSSPLSAVLELAAHGPQELAARYGQAGAAPWDWVPADARDRLRSGLGDDWPQAVTATFDRVWPGWDGADDATKAATLAQWIDTILGSPDEPAPPLPWVPADARDRLRSGLGDDWPQAVTTTFDQVWPGWDDADDATKAATLAQWIDTILDASVAAQPDNGAADVVIDERLQSDIAAAFEAGGVSLAEMDTAELDRTLQDAARLARAAKTS
jgi:hypothetical protein